MNKGLLIFSFSILVYSAFGQNNYPVPEYVNVPMFYDGKSNSLFSIERSLLTLTSRPTSPVSLETLAYVDGVSSKIRFSSKATISFITKLKVTDIDPSTYVTVLKFNVNNKKNRLRREYVLSNASLYHSGGTRPKIVECSYKKVANGVVMLTLSNIEPGEYFINFESETSYAYCFGIDSN